ncbi:transposase [Paenibacillus macerans]|nr:transposase [Paenibacillus macerans]
MRPEDKYSQIFEHLDLAPVMQALSKPKRRGRKEELNYPAMVYSLLIAKMEGIEFVSSIIKRLESSEEFRIQCRFTGSDRIPSESTYSRLNLALQQKGLLEQVLDRLVRAAHAEGFLTGAHIAVDSSAVEAWDLPIWRICCQTPSRKETEAKEGIFGATARNGARSPRV